MADEDDIFSRWSKRKSAVAEEAAEEALAKREVSTEVAEENEDDEAAILERLNLPVPETMQAGDDFSVFMQDAVPQFLRKRALRVLWRSNPVLACLDGLNDYDDDFNAPELNKKIVATAYRVGKGILWEPPEPEDSPELPDQTVAEQESPGDDDAVVSGDVTEATQVEPTKVAPETSGEEGEIAFQPKRMRFET